MRIALGLEYDGSAFLGWQTQPGGGAVQDALEKALAAVAGERVRTVCAGRTDRGVHARAQVVHFDTAARRPRAAWVRGTNAVLPSSVAVLWAREVDGEFHARRCALSRTYRYRLINRRVRPALEARYAAWVHAPLDLAAMRAAARALVGEHDFSAFRSAECQARDPVRRLARLDIEERDGGVEFVLQANAFLHHMVRNIVGTLLQVGLGRQPPTWVAEVLAARARALGPHRAAAGTVSGGGRVRTALGAARRSERPERRDDRVRTRVKICGLTRPEDVRAVAEAGADAFGLVFYPPSPRHLDVSRAAEIRFAAPAFLSAVALFVNPSATEVGRVIDAVRPDLLQFHGEEPPEFCTAFRVPWIKTCRVGPETDLLESLRPYTAASAWLLDSRVDGYGGKGVRFDWSRIPRNLARPVVLSGGLSPANVSEAVRRVRPWAVDVSSGVERAPGVKDAAAIAAFVSEVRNADCRLA